MGASGFLAKWWREIPGSESVLEFRGEGAATKTPVSKLGYRPSHLRRFSADFALKENFRPANNPGPPGVHPGAESPPSTMSAAPVTKSEAALAAPKTSRIGRRRLAPQAVELRPSPLVTGQALPVAGIGREPGGKLLPLSRRQAGVPADDPPGSFKIESVLAPRVCWALTRHSAFPSGGGRRTVHICGSRSLIGPKRFVPKCPSEKQYPFATSHILCAR